MLPDQDRIRVLHMLEAAVEATGYAGGRTRQALDADRMLRRALVHCLLILGEAAAQVSAQGRAHYPDVPWTVVVGMRNRLIHAYADVNLDVVWATVLDDLPSLIEQLENGLGQ
jgi:uncharacterized protein with HEPN domain